MKTRILTSNGKLRSLNPRAGRAHEDACPKVVNQRSAGILPAWWGKRAGRLRSLQEALALAWVPILACLALVVSLPLNLRAEPVLESLSPSDLLGILPKVPKEWKVTQSSGKKELSALDTPVASATRRYEIPRKDGEDPCLFTIEVVDMAAREGMVDHLRERIDAQLRDKKEGAEACNIGDIHGIIRDRDERGFLFQGILGKRLIVKVEAMRVNRKEFRALLESLDWSTLIEASGRIPVRENRSQRFAVGVVDELNPGASRSTIVAIYEPPKEGLPAAPAIPPPPVIRGPVLQSSPP